MYDNSKSCGNCGKPIPKDDTLCLYCGENPEKAHKIWFVIAAAIVAIILVIMTLQNL